MNSGYVEERSGGYYVARISLDSVVYSFERGNSREAILQQFPLLRLPEIHGAIVFCSGSSGGRPRLYRRQGARHRRVLGTTCPEPILNCGPDCSAHAKPRPSPNRERQFSCGRRSESSNLRREPALDVLNRERCLTC